MPRATTRGGNPVSVPHWIPDAAPGRSGMTSCLVVLSLLAGCSAPAAPLVLNGVTMGTSYTVKIAGTPLPVPAAQLNQAVFAALDSVDQRMSTYSADSELSRFNADSSTDWIEVSPELYRALSMAQETSRISGGAFDATVGPLVNLWGFGPEPAQRHIPGDAELSAALERVGYAQLELDGARPAARKMRADLYVDLSSVAEGYAVDLAADALQKLGVQNFMIEVGGEIRARGHNEHGRPWRIGIESPAGRPRIQHAVQVGDLALSTSGDYRNYFEQNGVRYSHIIDPADGRPIRHQLASVTVLHPSAGMADALSTALLVMGPERGYALAQTEKLPALFIMKTAAGFEERMTPGFAALLDE